MIQTNKVLKSICILMIIFSYWNCCRSSCYAWYCSSGVAALNLRLCGCLGVLTLCYSHGIINLVAGILGLSMLQT